MTLSAGLDELRFVVYGLFDPETNELRYIGKTNNPSLRRRFAYVD